MRVKNWSLGAVAIGLGGTMGRGVDGRGFQEILGGKGGEGHGVVGLKGMEMGLRMNEESAITNANHIFNTIHSAMRQWGSSLDHNGMSLLPVSIPVHTLFYHGTHIPTPPKGPEWLAFEIEHAEMFARPRPHRRGNGTHPPRERPPPPPPITRESTIQEDENNNDDDEEIHGYLHIYRTTQPLTLLYIDGMSAGKTSMGTLDTQDFILRLLSPSNNTRPSPGWGDLARATDLCALGTTWGVAGFVRMEAGFEVIFCDFSVGIELLSARQRAPSWLEGDTLTMDVRIAWFEYMRAVSERYGGVMGGRARVLFGEMVSAYFYDVDLGLGSDNSSLPRLVDVDLKARKGIRDDVETAIRRVVASGGNESIVDWQDVVDLIVARYAARLKFLILEDTTSKLFTSELQALLSLFVDYTSASPDMVAAVDQCTTHYLTPLTLSTPTDQLLYSAVSTVTGHICNVLFDIWAIVLEAQNNSLGAEGHSSVLDLAKSSVKDLIAWLDWSRWKECGPCAYDEICYVAMWPWGSKEDHYSPRCLNRTSIISRHGYWDFSSMGLESAGLRGM